MLTCLFCTYTLYGCLVVQFSSYCSALKHGPYDTNPPIQTWCSRGCSTITFVIHSFIHSFKRWSFCSELSWHCLSQTVRAKELSFWENAHPPAHVTCQVSHVRCQVSHVTCHYVLCICTHKNIIHVTIKQPLCSRGCSKNTFVMY